MNLEYFIARKVARSGNKSFSRLIIRIAIVAIALSISVMIVATSLIRGFKNEISNKIFGFLGHINITDTNSTLSDEEFPIDINQVFYPSIDTIGQVEYEKAKEVFGYTFDDWIVKQKTNGGIRHIQVYATKNGVIKTNKEIEGIKVKGIGKDFDWDFLKVYLKEGEPISYPDNSRSRDIILSEQTSDRLNLKLGDAFNIYFVKNGDYVPRRFKLKGKYRTGLADFDKRVAMVDIRQIQNLHDWSEDEVGGFEVFLDDINDINPLTEKLYSIKDFPDNLFALNIKKKHSAIFDWLELTNTNERVIISLMLIIAIINMITALLILILERTNMIGILKALGNTSWNIRKIFLYYASYIIVVGLFWGNLIGLTLCYIQYKYRLVTLPEADYYLSYAPIEMNWWWIIALNVGTLLVTLIFMIGPSYLVTRISPIKAIRFK